MVWLLLIAEFILWMSSPIIAEFLEYFRADERACEDAKSFVASEYLARIEKASLDILESRQPVDKIIVLWWGLDGLKLNEDGTMKWVSRKKKPVEPVLYQPCQSIQPAQTSMFLADQTQCTKARIDALMVQNTALQMQSWRSAQIANAFQQCCVQYPIQYPSYYYGGCCRLD